MKTKNIYQQRNINLRKIFEEFSPDQLLYVPIDVAKYNHPVVLSISSVIS